MARNGIWCVGNILVDNIKLISQWPAPETLVYVEKNQLSPGGGAVNVALDLARAGANFPLYLGGKIGQDHFGDYLLNYFKNYPIDTASIKREAGLETPWSDVMTEKHSGRRTFFHHTGAADYYSAEDICAYQHIPAKIFYLAYLSLLKSLDEKCPHFGCKAGGVLKELKEEGFIIAMDCVSAASPQFFEQRILPLLPYVDILILNEYEACLATGKEVNIKDENSLKDALLFLSQQGAKTIVIHYPQGAAAYHEGQISFHSSYKVTPDEIKGSVGAGDAFSAGLLYGLHEEWDIAQAIDLACTMARFNLTHISATEGIKPLAQMQQWQKQAEYIKSL